MTPTELKAARQFLGLSQAGLAEALRMGANGGRTVRGWELGERAVPGPVSVAVDCLLNHGETK
jgi:DNA-binding transcriptional regulator YiaG